MRANGGRSRPRQRHCARAACSDPAGLLGHGFIIGRAASRRKGRRIWRGCAARDGPGLETVPKGLRGSVGSDAAAPQRSTARQDRQIQLGRVIRSHKACRAQGVHRAPQSVVKKHASVPRYSPKGSGRSTPRSRSLEYSRVPMRQRFGSSRTTSAMANSYCR